MPMKAAWWQHQVYCGRVHHYCPMGGMTFATNCPISFQLQHVSILQWSFRNFTILLMAEILHQLIGSLSHYFYGFIHPRWCRISSINSNTIPCLGKTWEETIEDRIMRCQEGPVPMMHMQPSTWVRSHIDIAMIRSFCIRVYTNTCQNDQGKAAKHIKNFTAILGWWIIYHMPLHFLSTVTFHLESYKGSRITWFTWGFAEFAYKTPRPWNFM